MSERDGRFHGIHAAIVCPMREDFSIDEDALARHAAALAAVDGVNGFLINGHAGENFLLSRAELTRVIEVVRAATSKDFFLTSGVLAESALEAARLAADAERAGANAVLVFPPFSWALGHTPASVFDHHRIVASATSLPIVTYQAPVGAGGLAYRRETLARLCELPSLSAVKEGSWEVAAFEANYRFLRAERPDVSVLGSGDEHLLTSYLVGGDGSQVSLAAVTPEPVVALWRSAQAGDWASARALHERLYPLVVAIYRNAPASHATARLKAAANLLDPSIAAHARPPQQPLSAEEVQGLRDALALV